MFFNGLVKGRKRIRFGRVSTMVVYRNVKRVHCCIDERSKLGRVQAETFRVTNEKLTTTCDLLSRLLHNSGVVFCVRGIVCACVVEESAINRKGDKINKHC